MNPLDAGTELGQLLLDALVAAVQVVDALDHGFPLGHQPGDHQAGGGPQIGRHHRGAVELRHAFDYRRVSGDLDVGAHALQLERVHEAVLENGFGQYRRAARDAVERHELRLHIGRERRVRRSAQIDAQGRTVHLEDYGVILRSDLRAGLAQLFHHRFEYARTGVPEPHRSSGRGGGHEEGAGLYAVGHDAVLGARERAHALDGNRVAAGALDVRPHRLEAVREIDDFGLARRVLDYGGAFGQAGRHHQVLGAGRIHQIAKNARALQALCPRNDVAMLDANVRAHGLQALDVQVYRALADGAAAGQGYARLAAARQERPQHQDGGAHGLDQFVGRKRRVQAAGVELQAELLIERHRDAHAAEQIEQGGDVAQMRHVGEPQRRGREQRRAHDRQRRVLGPGDAHLTGERHAAVDQQFIHAYST